MTCTCPWAPIGGGLDLEQNIQTLRSFGYDDTITLEVFGDRRLLLHSVARLKEVWGESGG
ncbi:MAG: hypothetical protein R2856_26485 [Caldilineaceae bacterium]